MLTVDKWTSAFKFAQSNRIKGLLPVQLSKGSEKGIPVAIGIPIATGIPVIIQVGNWRANGILIASLDSFRLPIIA